VWQRAGFRRLWKSTMTSEYVPGWWVNDPYRGPSLHRVELLAWLRYVKSHPYGPDLWR
jgi:hypothetical protein